MEIVAIFVCGWLYTTLVEYCWHRWVLHSGHHAIHDAHHAEFFSSEYLDSRLLSNWALVAAAGHVGAAWLALGFMPAIVLAVSIFSYLGILEFLHGWIHRNPETWIAERHISHHLVPTRNFNVFLPFWDFIFRTA